MNLKKRDLILMNLTWNCKQSNTYEAAVKILLWKLHYVIAYKIMSDVYSEPYQKSKMECFAKIACKKAVFSKCSFLDT